MAKFKVGDRVHVANETAITYTIKAVHGLTYDLFCEHPDLKNVEEGLLTLAEEI